MKSITFVLSSLLASVAVAQPHRKHQARHHKRQDVVWVTDWDYVTETVGITTTIWVSEGFVPPTTSTEAPTTQTPSTSSPSTEVPAQFFQGQSIHSSAAAPAPTTKSSLSSVYVAPTQSSIYVAPSPFTQAAPAYVAPVESSSSSSVAPVYVAESTPVAAYSAPAATTSAAAPSVASSSSSSGGECSSGSPCEGDLTYYTAGLGACGITSDGDKENVVALPHGLMGTQSNGNPYCGKTITIKCTSTGKTTTATVVDKCMGCDGYSIDLSNSAFLELDDMSVGRTVATWYFN